MAQLELYIAKSQRGYRNVLTINDTTSVSRQVHDLGAALKILNYDPASGEVFYLVKHIDSGMLLSVLCPFAGVAGEHYSATLYIPRGVELSFEFIEDMLDTLGAALSRGDDPSARTVAELQRLLSTDWPVNSESARISINRGHAYVMARYGGSDAPSLADYARQHFYQDDYPRYAGVLLVSCHSNATAIDSARDITRRPLEQMVSVRPPQESASGFSPYLGQWPFTAPVLVAKGSRITLQWRRSGFESVEQTVDIESADTVITPIATLQAKKTISPSSFYISEQGSQRLLGAYLIKVNGRPINGPTVFTCAELADAKVEISSPGYYPFTGRLDLASTAQALIQMRQLDKSYRFDLPLSGSSGADAIRIVIKTKKPIEDSPVDGYVVEGDKILEGSGVSNKLVYVGGGNTHRRTTVKWIIIAAACFIAGLLTGWLCLSSPAPLPSVRPSAVSVDSIAAQTPQTPQTTVTVAVSDTTTIAAQQAAAEPDYKAAIAYLDGHRNWQRDDMEEIAGMAGLFDDLNSYNFDRIRNHWAQHLSGSRNFAAVVRAATGALNKRDPRTGKHKPTFVHGNDTTIGWLSYTYWIDP